MSSILNKLKESVLVQKKDGSLKGPYEASFTENIIIVSDLKADITQGDKIIRKLPNENDAYYYVTKVDCYSKSLGGTPPSLPSKIHPSSSITTNGKKYTEY